MNRPPPPWLFALAAAFMYFIALALWIGHLGRVTIELTQEDMGVLITLPRWW